MGNEVVTPSLKDWYTVPISKQLGMNISKHIEAGNFFLVFQGKDANGKDYIIKAYDYPISLKKIDLVKKFMEYYQQIKTIHYSSPFIGIVPFTNFVINDTMAFLVRPFYQLDLTDVAHFQQPELTFIEKEWISYQILLHIHNFHLSGFAHGDIKPTNIFVDRDLSVCITDLAEFKPDFVDLKRPMVYYHFFTSNTNSAFYLAPERIIKSKQSLPLPPSNFEISSSDCSCEPNLDSNPPKEIAQDSSINSIEPAKSNSGSFENLSKIEITCNENELSTENSSTDIKAIHSNENEQSSNDDFIIINSSNCPKEKSSDNLNTFPNSVNSLTNSNPEPITNSFGENYFNSNDKFSIGIPSNIPPYLNSEVHPYNKLQADLFSAGCSIAFLYLGGDNLFDILTIQSYMENKYDIKSKLDPHFNNKKFFQFILRLLSLKPEERSFSLQELDSIFPPLFSMFYNFLQYPEDQKLLNWKTVLKSLESSDPLYKLIPINWLSSILSSSKSLNQVREICDFLNDYCMDLSDFIKIERILPLFVSLLDPAYLKFHPIAISSILSLVQGLKGLPSEFSGIFTSYLLPYLIKIVEKIRIQISSMNDVSQATSVEFGNSEDLKKDAFALADFLPKIAVQLKRLRSADLSTFTQAFSAFLACTNYDIFRVFVNSLISVSYAGFEVLNSFVYIILTSINQPDNRYKISIFNIFLAFYRESSPHQRHLYILHCQDVATPIALGVLSLHPTDELLLTTLSFLQFVSSQGMTSVSFSMEISKYIDEYMFSPIPSVRALISSLKDQLESDIKDMHFLKIISKYSELKKAQKEGEIIKNKVKRQKSYRNSERFLPSKLFFSNNTLYEKPSFNISSLKPHFLSSNTFLNTTIHRIVRLTSLVTLNPGSYLAADESNRLRWLSFDQGSLSVMSTRCMASQVTALAAFPEKEIYAFAYSNGTISKIAYKAQKRRSGDILPSLKTTDKITSMKTISDSLLAIGYESSDFILDDIRSGEVVMKFQFENQKNPALGISDFAAWPNGVVMGIAQSFGGLTMIDLRMNRPFWFFETPPLYKIFALPSASNGEICYGATFLTGNAGIFQEPYKQQIMTVSGNNMFGFEFNGKALFIDDDSCQLIDQQFPELSRRLYDYTETSLHLKRKDTNFMEFCDLSTRPGSLHNNQFPITSVTRDGNSFISCDSGGFVNVWKVAD